MLSYAFKVLKQTNYEEVESESFDNIYDLFAEILVKGLRRQLKQGLYKEYISRSESIPTIRGKMILRDSIQHKLQRKQLMSCEYDELSEDNLFNQIIKAALVLLIKEPSVTKDNKSRLKKVTLYFSEISLIDPKQINWKLLQFQRNNQSYQMLLNICKFVIDGLLLTHETGSYKTPAFTDENMAMLFERFVLEYYKKHFPQLNPKAAYINWNIKAEEDYHGLAFLPQMKTDIVLSTHNKTLIIDTKFYRENLNKYGNIHSGNLYQIYSYVKNKDAERTGYVSGMLLYAQTSNQQVLDYTYNMGNNLISIKSIDLNQNFERIKEQLDVVGEQVIAGNDG